LPLLLLPLVLLIPGIPAFIIFTRLLLCHLLLFQLYHLILELLNQLLVADLVVPLGEYGFLRLSLVQTLFFLHVIFVILIQLLPGRGEEAQVVAPRAEVRGEELLAALQKELLMFFVDQVQGLRGGDTVQGGVLRELRGEGWRSCGGLSERRLGLLRSHELLLVLFTLLMLLKFHRKVIICLAERRCLLGGRRTCQGFLRAHNDMMRLWLQLSCIVLE
jgi:hypothetical protein